MTGSDMHHPVSHKKWDTKPVRPKMTTVSLRPVLDKRMPTLGSNAMFYLSTGGGGGGEVKKSPLSLSKLTRLEAEPARNMKQVRAILSREIDVIGKELFTLERMCYGSCRTAKEYFRKNMSGAKDILDDVGLSELSSYIALDEILKRVKDPKSSLLSDEDDLDAFVRICEPILENVPERLLTLAAHCERLFRQVSLYCVSFYDPETDEYSETASHYEEQIRNWKIIISKNIENVTLLCEQFMANGVFITNFSSQVTDLAKDYNCMELPCLLIVPETSANVRNVCFSFTNWLQIDEQYISFVKNDIQDLEHKRTGTARKLQDVRELCHTLAYKKSHIDIEKEVAQPEATENTDKAKDLKSEKDALSLLIGELQFDLEVKEYRGNQMKSHLTSSNCNPAVEEAYEELSFEIRTAKERIPLFRKQLSGTAMRLTWIEGKISHYRKLKREAKELHVQAREAEVQRNELETSYKTIMCKLNVLAKIHRLKSNPGCIAKMFHSLPVTLQKGGITGLTVEENALLLNACSAVAEEIASNWSELYRNLPFHPARGLATIEADIQDVLLGTARQTQAGLANKCLVRWRRYHTRPKAIDVYKALVSIKRYDLARKIDNMINPPVDEEESRFEKDDKDLPVPEELVPFYRQIERYDHLRASNPNYWNS